MNLNKIENTEFYDFFPEDANFRRMKAAHNKIRMRNKLNRNYEHKTKPTENER